jgi:hypothetical protein
MSGSTVRAAALAATMLGLILVASPADAAKKLSDWGFICKGAEGTDARNECCTTRQVDCVAECNDNYQGAARETCLGLCRQKGDTCRGEVAEIRKPPQGDLQLQPAVKPKQVDQTR